MEVKINLVYDLTLKKWTHSESRKI
jgi:transposase